MVVDAMANEGTARHLVSVNKERKKEGKWIEQLSILKYKPKKEGGGKSWKKNKNRKSKATNDTRKRRKKDEFRRETSETKTEIEMK